MSHIFAYQSAEDWRHKSKRLSEIYHENSKVKLRCWQARSQATSDPVRRAREATAARTLYASTARIAYGAKCYRQAPCIPLAATHPRRNIEAVMQRRRATRCFSGKSVSLDDLSACLRWSYGTSHSADPTTQQFPRRPVPSGGGLYPLEVYVLVFRVSGLEPGVYHYNAYAHTLERLREGDVSLAFTDILRYEELANGIGVAIVLSGILDRFYFKYGELSYRLILLEAGHVGQNLNLMATARHLGVCPIIGFDEDSMNTLLGIDGVSETALYLHVIGNV